jgi:hypothetical protein
VILFLYLFTNYLILIQFFLYLINIFNMSNPTTNYKTINATTGLLQDLSGIFLPLSLGTTYPTSTGYKVGNTDLNAIFADLSGRTPISYNTNYKVISTDLRNIFAPYVGFTTNGIISNSNPFSSQPTSGWTYILFNTVSSLFTFNTNSTINKLYYMIVGLGSNGRVGALNVITGGAGGGAGGIWNDFVNNFPAGNYNITIPNVSSLLKTTFINSSSPSTFSLIAESGQEGYRGAVDMSLNGINLSKCPSSTIEGQFGVGGTAGEVSGGRNGGGVFLNPGNTGNFLTFLGDNKLSNTLFGGGGGGGSDFNSTGINGKNGGSGGGGGGGGASSGVGGTGINGFTGGNGSGIGGVGGSAFTASTIPTKGYGGGGGGGGKSSPAGVQGAAGGIGGPAMLLLYF